MARLFTSGAETKAALTENVTLVQGGTSTVTFDTTTKRTASVSYKCTEDASGTAAAVQYNVSGGATGRFYYGRLYLYVPSTNPSTDKWVALLQDTTNVQMFVRYTNGVVQLADGTGTAFGSSSSTLATNTWHLIEFALKIPASGTNSGGLKVNGTLLTDPSTTTFTHNTATYTAIASVAYGLPTTFSGAANCVCYIDDLGLNDDQGTAQNSWLGVGEVRVLIPTADSAIGASWSAGAGGTTNLWQAVDNEPPAGLATASATNTSQIKNAANAASNYDATLQSYTAAGLGASDTVTLVQQIHAIGNSTTTATAYTVTLVSNPAIAVTSGTNTLALACGTFPSNWKLENGSAISYAPSVTLGTAPVIRFSKVSTTRSLQSCFMGLLVESVPGATGPVLAGTAAGVGSITNTEPLVSHLFVEEADGVSAPTAALTISHSFVGATLGVGALTNTEPLVSHPLVAESDGMSAPTAALSISHSLSGMASGSSSGTAAELTATTTWYVSTTGSDSNNGLTSGTAWQHVWYAISNSNVQAGDIITVADGTYNGWDGTTAHHAVFSRNGTALNPIKLRSTNKWGAVLSDSTPTGWNENVIQLGDYQIIEQFAITEPLVRIGVEMAGVGSTVRSNDIHDISTNYDAGTSGGAAVHTYASSGLYDNTGHTITGNRVRHIFWSPSGAGVHAAGVTANQYYHGIYLASGDTSGGTVLSWITNNEVYDVAGFGIQMEHNGNHAEVSSNTVAHTGFGVGISATGGTGDYNHVVNNVILDSAYGIREPANPGGAGNNVYEYNLIHDCTTAISLATGSTSTASNNITASVPGLVNYTAGTYTDAQDYHPANSSSACVNAGIGTASGPNTKAPPTIDYDGNTRPQGSGYDIGAFELVGGVSLAGATSGVGAGTAALSISHSLVAESDGVGLLTNAEPLVSHPLVGSTLGVSAPSATLTVSHLLVGLAGGVGTITNTEPLVSHSFVGLAGGAGTIANTEPLVSHSLVGMSSGVSTPTANLGISHTLVGETDGVAIAVSTLGGGFSGSGTASGVGTLTGALTIPHSFAAEADGIGSITNTEPLVSHPLVGATSGVSSSVASLTVSHSLVALASGVGSVVNTEPLVSHLFVGEADGVATPTAALTIGHPLVAEADGTAAPTSSALTIPHPLVGTSSGVAVATSTLGNVGPVLVGTASGVGAATGSLTVSHLLVEEADGVSAGAANLTVTRAIIGVTSGDASTTIATATVSHLIVAQCSGVAAATATLTPVQFPITFPTGTTNLASGLISGSTTLSGITATTVLTSVGGTTS